MGLFEQRFVEMGKGISGLEDRKGVLESGVFYFGVVGCRLW